MKDYKYGSKYITWNGMTKSHTEWARYAGLHPTLFSKRIREGMRFEEAIIPPKGAKIVTENRVIAPYLSMVWGELGPREVYLS